MKYSLAVLVAVFFIGISVSAKEGDTPKDDSSTTGDGTSKDQKSGEADLSTTRGGTSVDHKSKGADSLTTDTGPSIDQKPEEVLLPTEETLPQSPFIVQLVQKGAQKLQNSWSWLSGMVMTGGRGAGKLLGLSRSSSDVNNKKTNQEE